MGLGHLRRTHNVAKEVVTRARKSKILVLADSPVAPFFVPVPGVRYRKLPTILKTGRESWQTIANMIVALLADYPYVDTSVFCATVTEAVRSNDLSQASNLLEIQPLADSHIWPALAKLFKAFASVSPDYQLPTVMEKLARSDSVRWNQHHTLDEVFNFIIFGDE